MDNIIFVSHYDRQLAVNQKLLPTGKAHQVIHNGIAPLSPRKTEERLGVGYIGRFVYQKNPELFLDIAEQLPDQKFVMAGGGELTQTIRDAVKQRGLEDRLTLVGELNHADALEFISKLDVLVMTPRWEGLPLLPLEAMFKKIPIVSTAVGGIPEVIEHRRTGLLSESGEALDMANKVQSLLSNDTLTNTIVDRAHQEAHLRFTQTKMLQDVERTYMSLPNLYSKVPLEAQAQTVR